MYTIDYLEITGCIVCEELVSALFFSYKKSIEPWLKCCKEEGVIQYFGKEVDFLVKKILLIYETEAVLFKNTNTFKQKKKILKYNILYDMQKIFEMQISKIKNMTIQTFKEVLAPIQITDSIEKDIYVTMKIVQVYFNKMVNLLFSRYSKEIWSHQNELTELVQNINEIAIERLQKAKIQGMYTQKRSLLGVSFYFLHPHPFGKDLRFSYINNKDSFNFNSDFISKAEAIRYSTLSAKEVKNILPDVSYN